MNNYLEVVEVFARMNYTSIYVIDHQRKEFEFVSENPLFLCGSRADEIKEMGFGYYRKYVIKNDLKLLLRINRVGFDFFEKTPLTEKKLYTISCDFHIVNQKGRIILINQKQTPLFLTQDGEILKSICVVSLSSEKQSGNIQVFKKGSNVKYLYDLKNGIWKKESIIKLSNREKEILRLSSRGFTVNEISEDLYITSDTVKFHKRKLFKKLEVNNISEAIVCAINNKLI